MKTEQQLQLVSFEQSKRLERLGFYFPTLDGYLGRTGEIRKREIGIERNWNNSSDMVSAPAVALALKWLRDERCSFGDILFDVDADFPNSHKFRFHLFCEEFEDDLEREWYPTYEQAESALLDELIMFEEKKKIHKESPMPF
jgi:hypothetical protein